jgi:PilZ domain
MIRRNLPSQPTKQRSVRRCPLVASVEVTELDSRTLLSGRTSEIGLGGCYVDSLNSFPEGSIVGLRILRDQGVFETKAKVVYSDPGFGMGLAFTDMMPNQRSLLEAWLAEIVSQLRLVS